MHPAVSAIATGVGRNHPALAVVFGFTPCLRGQAEVKSVHVAALDIARGDMRVSSRKRERDTG